MLRVTHHVSHKNPRLCTSQAGDQKPKIGKSLKRRFFGSRTQTQPSRTGQELPLALGKMVSNDDEKIILNADYRHTFVPRLLGES
jgi:hypothetical protein